MLQWGTDPFDGCPADAIQILPVKMRISKITTTRPIHHYQTDAAAGAITPTFTVRPCWEGTDQQKNEQDK